jgi:septum formation protein
MTAVEHPRLILASGSPRRQELLREAGYEFLVSPADIDESAYPPTLSPAEVSEHLALAKAREVSARFPDDVVLAADTVVALGNESLGKPAGAADARRLLSLLSGTTHEVITGVAVIRASKDLALHDRVASSVQMRRLSEAELEAYLATGDWEGKAGAYGIQDRDPFVTRTSGCHTNIVGLPMTHTARLLAAARIHPKR